uniref:(northern house mosquito) hypothetical protein n=1 Tax=Culex pipiens TaxID=7175 RepID=A0A8D8BAE2_CULPI
MFCGDTTRTCKFKNSPMCIIGQCTIVTLIRYSLFSTKQPDSRTSSSKWFASYRSSIKSTNLSVCKFVRFVINLLRAANSWPPVPNSLIDSGSSLEAMLHGKM